MTTPQDEGKGFKGLGKLGAGQPPPPADPSPPSPPPQPPPAPPPGPGAPPAGGAPAHVQPANPKPHASTPPPGTRQPYPTTGGGMSGCAKVALVLFGLAVAGFLGLIALAVWLGNDPEFQAQVAAERAEEADRAEMQRLKDEADRAAAAAAAAEEAARVAVCRVDAGSRPDNGEMLVREIGRGDHTLKVNNGGSDVLFKLRQDGRTVVAFYVHAFAAAAVDDLPDGTYQVLFASGEEFSRGCREFMGGMSVSADPNPLELTVTVENGEQYYEIMEYTLQRVEGGNLEPDVLDPREFRD